MSLEPVELLLELEHSLGISISDDEIGQIETVGDLFEVVLRRKRGLSTERSDVLVEQTFQLLERELRKEFGLPRPITSQDWLDGVLPRRGRRRRWRVVSEHLGLRLPALVRPPSVLVGSAIFTTAAGGGTAYLASATDDLPMLAGMILGVGLAGISTALLTRPLATALPQSIRTMGQLAETVVAYNYNQLAERFDTSGPDGVWEAVRRIVADVYGTDVQQIGRHTSFITDL